MPAIAFICWGAFILVWLGGYLYSLARAPKTIRGDSRGGLIRVLVAIAVFLLLSRRAFPEGVLRTTLFTDPRVEAIGSVVLLASTAFTLWARWTLGVMWASTATIKEGHELRTD